MKAKFSVSPTLRAGKEHGVESLRTPLLMVTKFLGMDMGDDLKKIAQMSTVATSLKDSGFNGDRGEHLTIALGEDGTPERVLFVGMGKAQSFDCGTIRDMIRVAVERAVAQKCERLTIPILPNRLTATQFPLKGSVHIIKTVAVNVLAGKEGDGVLHVELVCTPQAQRHVKAGLSC
ncbi:MAG: hypothetical protein K2Z81_02510, partial [Cyanobacteria bacterium]|nr:hypothetical protein [Cyanobacteriota bacterium]